MRRYWREQHPASTFRGAELPRLLTGVVMLAVVYMLIVRTGDPDTWRWLAKGGGAPPAKQVQPPASPMPKAAGPTDEDPDQAEAAREEFQVLTDGSLKLGPEEMVPYDRLVEWTKEQSFARLYQRAHKDLWYTHLHDAADKHRGGLVALDLEVRRADETPVKNRFGVELREAWGVTEESRGRLYVLVVVDYPKGMPAGGSIREKARFAGYFLKLQGYEAASAKPGQLREKAPLLIGRLEWEPAAATTTDNTQELAWGLVVLAVLGLAWVMWLIYGTFRGKKAVVPAPIFGGSAGKVTSLDAWLERSSFSADEDGNTAEEEDEYAARDSDHEDDPRRGVPRFPDDLERG